MHVTEMKLRLLGRTATTDVVDGLHRVNGEYSLPSARLLPSMFQDTHLTWSLDWIMAAEDGLNVDKDFEILGVLDGVIASVCCSDTLDMFQANALQSSEAVARKRPSGLQLRPLTTPSCPLSKPSCCSNGAVSLVNDIGRGKNETLSETSMRFSLVPGMTHGLS